MSRKPLLQERVVMTGTNLQISELCLGTADLGSRLNIADSISLLREFFDRGGNFLDTAHCYAFWADALGIPEQIVGEFAREVGRENLVIATKGGHCGVGEGYPRPDQFLTPTIINSDMDESLERLCIDSVDLFYLHRDDPRIPAEEILEFTNELVHTGKAKCIGASNWSIERVIAANQHARSKGLAPFVALQNAWNLGEQTWRSDVPGEVRFINSDDTLLLNAVDVSVIPYSANANGYFASRGVKSADAYGNNIGRSRLARCLSLAKDKGLTPGTIALSYLSSHPFQVVPIVGTCNVEHLDEAITGVSTRLSEYEIVWLRDGESADSA